MFGLEECRVMAFVRILKDVARAKGITIQDVNYYDDKTQFVFRIGKELQQETVENEKLVDGGLLMLARETVMLATRKVAA